MALRAFHIIIIIYRTALNTQFCFQTLSQVLYLVVIPHYWRKVIKKVLLLQKRASWTCDSHSVWSLMDTINKRFCKQQKQLLTTAAVIIKTFVLIPGLTHNRRWCKLSGVTQKKMAPLGVWFFSSFLPHKPLACSWGNWIDIEVSVFQ